MKYLRRILSVIAAACIVFSMLPAACAEAADDEYFKDKSWDDVIADLFEKHGIDHDRITLGYYNTVTGEEHYYQPDKYMIGASIYKVPLNMAYAEKIANGEMDWDTPIPYYPYEQMMRSSIIDSNNELSGLLMFNLGGTYRGFLNYIAPYLGVDIENVDPQYYNERYTARQYVTCLRTLYDNPERFPKIIDTMKEAEPNNYFRLDEKRYEIAHKYGYWPDDYLIHINDVGIVYTDDPIILVIFTASVANAYQVMTDYCTLMCDYTMYHRAERLAAEAKAEAEKLVEASPVIVPEVVPSLAPVVETEESSSESKSVFSPLLGIVLVVIAAFLAIAAVIYFSKKGRMNMLWAMAAVIITALAALLCLLASSVGTLIARPQGDPQQTITGFFDAMSAGDYDTAYTYLDGYTGLGLENVPADSVSAAVYEALRESYEYELFGGCSVDKLKASQQVQFSYLDLKAIQADVQALTVVKLEEIVMARPSSEIYDENKNYLPGITMEAYSAAVNEVLKSADKYYATDTLQLQLEYKNGSWLIVPGNDLLKAVIGGTY
ncbi:MAG: hypothetical protein IJ364_06850 [Oscillospiraceae bacterium]|nr:hypothetical protein [Oscillospiraceae bacterium]